MFSSVFRLKKFSCSQLLLHPRRCVKFYGKLSCPVEKKKNWLIFPANTSGANCTSFLGKICKASYLNSLVMATIPWLKQSHTQEQISHFLSGLPSGRFKPLKCLSLCLHVFLASPAEPRQLLWVQQSVQCARLFLQCFQKPSCRQRQQWDSQCQKSDRFGGVQFWEHFVPGLLWSKSMLLALNLLSSSPF